MDVVLGIGSNQGDRFAALQTAIDKLTPHLKNIQCSGVYSSPALLLPNSPEAWNKDFLNMCVKGSTEKSPEALLVLCKQIETEMGRETEHAKWSPRVIDIDILIYGDVKMETETLTIPHPLIYEREFVMLPLCELDSSLPATYNLQPKTTLVGHFA